MSSGGSPGTAMAALQRCAEALRGSLQRPDLYSACEPLWRASSLLGLFPFDLRRGGLRLSAAKRAYSCALLLLMASMQVCHVASHVSANSTGYFSVYEFGLLFLYVNRTFIYVLSVVPTLWRCARVKTIFCRLSAAEYSPRQRARVFGVVVAQLATVCAILASSYITKCSRSTGGYLHILHVFGMLGDFAILLVTIQFATLVSVVGVNVANLNGVLRLAIRSCRHPGVPRRGRAAADVLSVARAHGDLCDTAGLINSTFSVQLLSVITDVFMASTYCLYGVVFKVVAEPENIPKIVVGISSFNSVIDIVVLTINIVGLWWIVSTCVATQSQEKRSAALVHKLLDVTRDADVREKMEVFSLQLLHQKIEFNPCGFFTIDFSLVYSYILGGDGRLSYWKTTILEDYHNRRIPPGDDENAIMSLVEMKCNLVTENHNYLTTDC